MTLTFDPNWPTRMTFHWIKHHFMKFETIAMQAISLLFHDRRSTHWTNQLSKRVINHCLRKISFYNPNYIILKYRIIIIERDKVLGPVVYVSSHSAYDVGFVNIDHLYHHVLISTVRGVACVLIIKISHWTKHLKPGNPPTLPLPHTNQQQRAGPSGE